MALKIFLTIKAVISLVFGLISLCIPTIVFPYYGISLDAAGIAFSQWFGTALIGIGLICWFARAEAKSGLRQAVLLSLFICDTIGFVVSLYVQLRGVSNALGWSNVAIWLLLALGLGYFRFLRKD